MPEWTCLGNPASSFGEVGYGQPVTVGWWRPHRRPLLKEREKGRTPSCFTSTIQATRVTLPALIGPTRRRSVHGVRFHLKGKLFQLWSVWIRWIQLDGFFGIPKSF